MLFVEALRRIRRPTFHCFGICYLHKRILRDFQLPPCSSRRFHSCGTLCGVVRQLVTDVSGQPIGPTFKGQSLQEELTAWTFRTGPILRCATSVVLVACILGCKVLQAERWRHTFIVVHWRVIFLPLGIGPTSRNVGKNLPTGAAKYTRRFFSFMVTACINSHKYFNYPTNALNI